jgi:uncharacterized membrane protein YeaQ/YmgE (transglycosylase-associated protein family)
MSIAGLVVALLVGAVCGFLSRQIVKGHGFGAVGNIVVGIAGGTIGAFILLFLIGLIKKAT